MKLILFNIEKDLYKKFLSNLKKNIIKSIKLIN